jgi:hypothetical protein
MYVILPSMCRPAFPVLIILLVQFVEHPEHEMGGIRDFSAREFKKCKVFLKPEIIMNILFEIEHSR